MLSFRTIFALLYVRKGEDAIEQEDSLCTVLKDSVVEVFCFLFDFSLPLAVRKIFLCEV